MAPDVPKIDADRHLNLGPPDGYFCDELMRWFFHGNSLSDPKDLLIPFIGNLPKCELKTGVVSKKMVLGKWCGFGYPPCYSGPPFDHGGTIPFMRAYAISWPMCSLS